MIKPTVGRMVWFWPGIGGARERGMAYSNSAQPLAAQITYVHSDHMVNLAVFDQKGATFGVTSVELLQGDRRPPLGIYCEWMPYQKGQAAKVEALEAKTAPVTNSLESTFANTFMPAAQEPATGEGPKVTREHLESIIISEHYFTGAEAARIGGTEPHPLDLVTFCTLTLQNGFTVTGSEACASRANFDRKLGEQYAREKAIEQLWPLEGYLLKQRLYEQDQDAEQMLAAELDAGTAAAEALVDHLDAMGSPGRVTIPVKRGDREFEITATRK